MLFLLQSKFPQESGTAYGGSNFEFSFEVEEERLVDDLKEIV